MCRRQLPQRHLVGRSSVLGEGKDKSPSAPRLASRRTANTELTETDVAFGTSLSPLRFPSRHGAWFHPGVLSAAHVLLWSRARRGGGAFPALKAQEVRVVPEHRTPEAGRGTPTEPPPASSQSQGERHPQGQHTGPSWTLLQPQRFLFGLSACSCGFLADRKGGWHCPGGHVRAGGCWVRLGLRNEPSLILLIWCSAVSSFPFPFSYLSRCFHAVLIREGELGVLVSGLVTGDSCWVPSLPPPLAATQTPGTEWPSKALFPKPRPWTPVSGLGGCWKPELDKFMEALYDIMSSGIGSSQCLPLNLQ